VSSYSLDENLRVLVLRLWREPREIEGAQAVWRGVVEDVSSGNQYYVKDLGEINQVIIQQLKEMGIDM
jgi:hypothetical protein